MRGRADQLAKKRLDQRTDNATGKDFRIVALLQDSDNFNRFVEDFIPLIPLEVFGQSLVSFDHS
jgi:hypothetical protein